MGNNKHKLWKIKNFNNKKNKIHQISGTNKQNKALLLYNFLYFSVEQIKYDKIILHIDFKLFLLKNNKSNVAQ